MNKSRHTKPIKIGRVIIGGNAPISIQSMCSTKTSNTDQTLDQIHNLEEAGCEIIRVAVKDKDDVNALPQIKKNISIPLVADIHFNPKLAIAATRTADKIRINPGNINSETKIKEILRAAKDSSIPIRIGVNSGSIEKSFIEKYGNRSEAMAASCLHWVDFFENNDFRDIVVSLKASDIKTTINANELFSQRSDYPIHLGITESGPMYSGIIKTSVGFGYLLLNGIGDTVRVSLTAHPSEEVKAAKEILKALDLKKGLKIISCPTCGRSEIDVIRITRELEKCTAVKRFDRDIKVTVMGCVVNGPGEAKEADLGVAGSNNKSAIFMKGRIIKTVENEKIIDEMIELIKKLENE